MTQGHHRVPGEPPRLQVTCGTRFWRRWLLPKAVGRGNGGSFSSLPWDRGDCHPWPGTVAPRLWGDQPHGSVEGKPGVMLCPMDGESCHESFWQGRACGHGFPSPPATDLGDFGRFGGSSTNRGFVPPLASGQGRVPPVTAQHPRRMGPNLAVVPPSCTPPQVTGSQP